MKIHTLNNKVVCLNKIIQQSGQAMVEYAILLILLVTLVLGGAELGISAFHSSKVNESAKAGANAWASSVSFNQSGTSLSETEKQNRMERVRESLLIDTNSQLSIRDSGGVLISEAICDVIPGDVCPLTADADEVRPKLGDRGLCKTGLGEDINNNGVLDPGEDTNGNGVLDYAYYDLTRLDGVTLPQYSPDLPIDITSCDTSKAEFISGIRSLLSDMGLDYDNADPMTDYYEVCTSRLNNDGIEKIIPCRPIVDTKEDDNNDGVVTDEDLNLNGLLDVGEDINGNGLLDLEDTNANSTPENVPNGRDDIDLTFRRLLISKLDSVGNPRTPAISREKVSLGIHNPAVFRNPSCLGSGLYDDGLPNDGKIYLFNPLPINVTNCSGGNNSVDELLTRLPSVNRALASQYNKICVFVTGGQISFGTFPGNTNRLLTIPECAQNGGQIWLKPPGKICGASGGGETCPDPLNIQGDGDGVFNMNGATGYYFFGNTNVATVKHKYLPSGFENPSSTFRPTFQIVCDGSNFRDFNIDAGGACQENSELSSIQPLEVNVRFRSVYESFLTFGLDELNNSSLIPFFYNPSKVGIGSSNLVGMAGAEVGPIGSSGLPTIKKFKDFRGCFSVNITAPNDVGGQVSSAISACN